MYGRTAVPPYCCSGVADGHPPLQHPAALVALNPGEEPLAAQLRAGMDRAAEAIDSGAARRVLERWVAVSNA
jgi:anthranilate phosphoribosyltransferase